MKVRVHVWHKVTGEIIAIGSPMGEAKCIPLSGRGEAVTEAEVEDELIRDLHRTHIVDVHRKVVTRRSS